MYTGSIDIIRMPALLSSSLVEFIENKFQAMETVPQSVLKVLKLNDILCLVGTDGLLCPFKKKT